MDKAIVTALLIIISMVMALMLYNVAYPAVAEGGDAITSMANRADERMKSQIRVVHAGGELDADGWWQDANLNSRFDVFVWVKNTGDMRLTGLDNLDLFFGPEGNYTRIPHQSTAAGFPYWSWTLENASEWQPTATLRLTISYGTALAQGRYFVKVVLPNGVDAEYFVGM